MSSEASFFEALEKAGLELRMKDLQIFAGGMKKADWDVGMAVDAIRMSPFLDVVILVTGDGDFLPLVDYLKWGAGRLVEVVAFRRERISENSGSGGPVHCHRRCSESDHEDAILKIN